MSMNTQTIKGSQSGKNEDSFQRKQLFNTKPLLLFFLSVFVMFLGPAVAFAVDGTTTRPDGLGPNVAEYGTVKSYSSMYSAAYSPAFAIDGDTGTDWATDADGANAYIEIGLPSAATITHIGFQNRPGDYIDSFTVIFSDGSSQTCVVNQNGIASFQYYDISDVVTSSIRIDAVTVSGSPNVGAIEIKAYRGATSIVNVFDFIPVKEHAAIVNGTTTYDSTDAIQDAIDYVSANNGGTVYFPAGLFKISSTINAKSFIALKGAYGEDDSFGVQGPKRGTELFWIGSSTGTILSVFNVRLFKLEGMHFDGDNNNITAILLDSNNNPSGSQNEFHRFSTRKCKLGVQWGTTGIAGGSCANDGTRFSTFTIWSQMTGSKGFVINSGNAGQMSVIESGGIQVEDIGIDIVVANMLQIRRVFGGGVMDTAFIRSSVGIGILIEGCSSEAWGSGRTWRTNRPAFLKVIAPVETYPVIECSITMIQNQINNPVRVEYPVRIVSTGDNWGYCNDYETGAAGCATGTFTSPNSNRSMCVALNNGVNPASINMTTAEPAMGWIDSNYVDLTNLDAGRGWVVPAYASSNFYGGTGVTWTVENTDVETYAYTLINRTMTLSFKIKTSTISGSGAEIRIKIPNGKLSTRPVLALCRLVNGSVYTGFAYVSSGGNYISIQKMDTSNFSTGTNNVQVQGQITFEVN